MESILCYRLWCPSFCILWPILILCNKPLISSLWAGQCPLLISSIAVGWAMPLAGHAPCATLHHSGMGRAPHATLLNHGLSRAPCANHHHYLDWYAPHVTFSFHGLIQFHKGIGWALWLIQRLSLKMEAPMTRAWAALLRERLSSTQKKSPSTNWKNSSITLNLLNQVLVLSFSTNYALFSCQANAEETNKSLLDSTDDIKRRLWKEITSIIKEEDSESRKMDEDQAA